MVWHSEAQDMSFLSAFYRLLPQDAARQANSNPFSCLPLHRVRFLSVYMNTCDHSRDECGSMLKHASTFCLQLLRLLGLPKVC